MKILKKMSIFFVAVLLCLLVVGCSNKKEDTKEKEASETSAIMQEETDTGIQETTTKNEETGTTKTTKTTKTAYEDKGAIKTVGIDKSQSFSIKMTNSYTYTDPSYVDFDTRYVLYGDSKCNMARAGSAQGQKCIAAYEILYAKNGKATGEFKYYVMASKSDAQNYEKYLGKYYNDSAGNMKCARVEDVVYIYQKGDYVQKTYIDLYAKQGTISEATPEAYLGMQFFFRGMSNYEFTGSDNKAGTVKKTTVEKATEKSQKKSQKKKKTAKKTAKKKKKKGSSAVNDTKEKFVLTVGDGYVFEDPSQITFDTRYVLHGNAKCEGVKAVKSQGIQTTEVYLVLYTKKNKVVKEYRLFVVKDSEEAKKMTKLYGGTIYKNVVVLESSAQNVNQFIQYYVKYGGMTEDTPQAYIQYMMDNEGFEAYKQPSKAKGNSNTENKDDSSNGGNTNQETSANENPKEETEVAKTVTGFDKENSFDVVMSNDYTFTDPKEIEFDTRYVLYGGTTCQYAKQYNAVDFYEIMYSKENKVVAEYKCYVTSNAGEAEKLKDTFKQHYGENVTNESNVVILYLEGDYTQQTIDLYAKMGMCEGTPKAYLEKMFITYSMVECKNGDSHLKPAVTETETVTVATTKTLETVELGTPKQVRIRKVSVKKKSEKKIKLTLKKINGVKGYQIAVYRSRTNAKKNKNAIVKKFTSKYRNIIITSKKLKDKKTLYVRACAYKLNGKVKVYGKWSNYKRIKIKK